MYYTVYIIHQQRIGPNYVTILYEHLFYMYNDGNTILLALSVRAYFVF